MMFLLCSASLFQSVAANPPGGALDGDRPRIFITSDIGGTDDDDQQSLIHFLLYANEVDLEGIAVGAPGGRESVANAVIDAYGKDYNNLRSYDSGYPTASHLKGLVGASLVSAAKKSDSRPLWVLVWGCIDILADALRQDSSIKSKIRVHFLSAWNSAQCSDDWNYVKGHGDLYMIENYRTLRALSHWPEGKTFVSTNIKGHGALGTHYVNLDYDVIVEGDSPSFLYLIRGNPDDPTQEHWGGQYKLKSNKWYVDIGDQTASENTITKWKSDILAEMQKRFDWAKTASSTPAKHTGPPVSPAHVPDRYRIDHSPGRTSLTFCGAGPHEFALYTLRGELMCRRRGCGDAVYSLSQLAGISGNPLLLKIKTATGKNHEKILLR
jgi:hypothetical protein